MSRQFTICLPIADRQRAYAFYQNTLGLTPVGEPDQDGVPEPLQFQLDQSTTLMLIPSDGFGWVLGNRAVTPPGSSEVLLSLTLGSEAEVTTITHRMLDSGGEVLAEPIHQEWGFVAVVSDPDGHAWQLIADPSVS